MKRTIRDYLADPAVSMVLRILTGVVGDAGMPAATRTTRFGDLLGLVLAA
jgi:hypothetical protein